MIARAVAMRQMLRDDQEASERRGYYSEEIHEAFKAAGFYRVLQPRMFGGYEFDLVTYYRVSTEVARGGSAGMAWCLGLASHHAYIIASFFPEQAQREIFGTDGHFACGARAGGTATARAIDGGYLLNGRWRYSSGVPYSTHHLVHVRIEGPGQEDGPPEGALCWAVAPRDQYEVLWDWGNFNDLGLQASGSNTVEMQDAFIPKHWLALDDWRNFDQSNGTPGTRLHGNPMYLGVHAALYHAGLIAPQVGCVRAALDEYETLLKTTPNRMAPGTQSEDRGFQQAFGLATSLCDAAEMILIRAGQMAHEYFDRWARTGQPFTPEEDTRLHGALQQAGRLAWRAMEQIWTNSPVDAAKAGARIARYYRDISMYRLHVSARPLFLAPRLAELHFGLSNESPPGGPG